MFSGLTMQALKKGLDAAALRHRVIANNIANANTPGFKKSAVEFESLFKEALGRNPVGMAVTHPRHMGKAPLLSELQPVEKINNATSMRTDGNNVDIDEEMVNLAANDIHYQAMARELSERYALLSYVITGGRR
ncbi:flagellar basal body protein [Pelotomaculum thermopropionicum SI]|uniref:Flagellar basal body rod protein FlgB n=1 Tax=Pelotomaculum thermopropionicum (strain DSM 13744 / JCM 10971 / SI) TaxID=370438 RepID=A5D0G0_PELTS|nr:flagellar basal body protein [Pelotomaculum thermopropionicum SI]